jgi:hypothetical protein
VSIGGFTSMNIMDYENVIPVSVSITHPRHHWVRSSLFFYSGSVPALILIGRDGLTKSPKANRKNQQSFIVDC